MKKDELELGLGEHLAAALRHLDADVVSAHPLTTLPTQHSPRSSFRLELTDGRTLKARRMKDEKKAARMTALLAELKTELKGARFPRVLFSRGALVIEEWIAGTPLAEHAPDDDRIARAGAILGSLHAMHTIAGMPLHAHRSTGAALQKLEQDLDLLVGERLLTEETGRRALEHATRHRPEQATTGLIHGDFCAENLVVDRSGELFVVDNETMRIDHLDYDLARTWLRWPMSEPRWARFLAGYVSRRECAPSETFGFWKIVAILKSAAKHQAWRTSGASAALIRLEEVLAEGGSARATP